MKNNAPFLITILILFVLLGLFFIIQLIPLGSIQGCDGEGHRLYAPEEIRGDVASEVNIINDPACGIHQP